MKKALRLILKVLLSVITALVIAFTIVFYSVTAEPEPWQRAGHVNDVTQLNPIAVSREFKPKSIDEISKIVRQSAGPISIGGARHSMGGQIAFDHAVHLDMRDFNQIVSFSPKEKLITVESGITWRAIQEHIDPYDLSVSIMQTYANFTVGGSLSVNVHGRYVGLGAIIHSVQSFSLIMSNGRVVQCSREKNPELFYGAIGGYGALGVIGEVTLQLTDNCRVERITETMDVSAYRNFFMSTIRDDSAVVFHNADLYPDDYTTVRSVSYYQTLNAATVEERLKPKKERYRWERFGMWMVSELGAGPWLRQHLVDPIYYSSDKIVWRNYEASYDANELEPASREASTYVLQEYFVPVDSFDVFVPRMAAIFKEHRVNTINVSIRHASPDRETLLSWSRHEVFSFVIYYKQGTSVAAQQAVGIWTRKLIDAALQTGGSYYLPYQLHATQQQFEIAYPRAQEFFALKSSVDSANRFTNRLIDKYDSRKENN